MKFQSKTEAGIEKAKRDLEQAIEFEKQAQAAFWADWERTCKRLKRKGWKPFLLQVIFRCMGNDGHDFLGYKHLLFHPSIKISKWGNHQFYAGDLTGEEGNAFRKFRKWFARLSEKKYIHIPTQSVDYYLSVD